MPGKVPPNAKFGDKLERIGSGAFYNCPLLRRIAIPLKDGMITDDNVFHGCKKLERVDLIGEVHETVATLSLKNWRDDVNEEIGRINRVLPTTPAGRADSAGVGKKAREVRKWIRSVLRKIDYYKAQHDLLKEYATIIEMALWKKRLEENGVSERDAGVRAQHRVDCGADANIVIRNVHPFLELPFDTFEAEDDDDEEESCPSKPKKKSPPAGVQKVTLPIDDERRKAAIEERVVQNNPFGSFGHSPIHELRISENNILVLTVLAPDTTTSSTLNESSKLFRMLLNEGYLDSFAGTNIRVTTNERMNRFECLFGLNNK